jgi:hypothetical protein
VTVRMGRTDQLRRSARSRHTKTKNNFVPFFLCTVWPRIDASPCCRAWSQLQGDSRMPPIPSFTAPHSFPFHALPVSQSLSVLCSRISGNYIYHGRCHAATVHSRLHRFSFFLAVTTATLSLFFLCVPCKTPAHSVPHPDFAATASFPFFKTSDFVSRYDVCI